MKRFSRLLIVFVVSATLILPEKIALACGPWPAPPEDFRLSLFNPSNGDVSNQFQPYYFSLNQYYKADGIEDFATNIEVNQNYREWQQQLNTPFLIKDFYKAIEEYSYTIITDSANELRKSNSFINVLMSSFNRDYFNYFKLAKSTEGFNGINADIDSWGLNNNLTVPNNLLNQLYYTLHHTTNKFIQQRTAYLLCRLLFYNKNLKGLVNVFNTYLNKENVQSWVKASAKYYVITLKYTDSSLTKNYCRALVDVIDSSKDKRMACIKILNQQPVSKVLPLLKTNHQKAIALATYAIRNPGYALTSIRKIYLLDHTNKFIPLLISREINKLEDWLLTPELTEYGTPASRSDYWGDDEANNNATIRQNVVKDTRYANALLSFIKDINHYATAIDKLSYDADLCHLNFLLKNYETSGYYCNTILQNADEGSAAWLQARINAVLIALQQKKQLDTDLKNDIVHLLTILDNVQDKYIALRQISSSYNNGYTIKDNLLVYLGRTALQMHDIVNASLLLSGTDKPWGEYQVGDDKNSYFLLYEHANENDYDKLIAILHSKEQTAYERYFTKRKVYLYGNYSFSFYGGYYGNEVPTYLWDVNKVLDLKGTCFINHDELEKAQKTFRMIPASFWTDSNNIYRDYLRGNPFKLNIYDSYGHREDSVSVNNPNKAQFVEKLISLKERAAHTQNMEEKASLYYAIGNAYYSMSFYGKYWLMSKLWWSIYEMYDLDVTHITPFDANYYGTRKAKEYYRLAFNLTKDPKRAAFYCIYLTNCENNNRELIAFIDAKGNKKNYDDDSYNYNPSIYASLLNKRSGSQQYYNRLIKECPLYSAFRSSIEK